jgi:cytochrome c2
MSASVRFVASLLVIGASAAPVSFAVMRWQAKAEAQTTAEQLTRGSVERGKLVIGAYGCGSCHVIPGITAANGQVGPLLKSVAVRVQIAGKLANSPEAMTHWLRSPQTVVPGNGMPNQGLNEQEARDAAAYLYTLK